MKRIAIVVIAALLSVSSAAVSGEEGNNSEARAYALSILNPLFDKYMNKRGIEKDPAGLTNRIQTVYQQIVGGKVSIMFSGDKLPKDEVALFTSGYDSDNRRPRITAHTLHLQERQKKESPESFADVLAVSIGHEVIHLEVCKHELGYRHSEPEIRTEEAAAWGITIIEIVRPLAEQGRVPYRNMLLASEPLSRFGDDYARPEWVSSFANMIDVGRSR